MKQNNLTCAQETWGVILFALWVLVLSGCSASIQVEDTPSPAVQDERKIFGLNEITPQQAMGFLSELGLGTASISPDFNGIVVTGSAGDLYRAGIALDLVDTSEAYIIETLTPVSNARMVPTNGQIAEALGSIAVGTFANPPQAGERGRAIIDIHGESVVAIVPARIQRELLAFVEFGAEGLRRARGEPEAAKTAETAVCEEAKTSPPVAEGNEPAEVILATVLPNVPVEDQQSNTFFSESSVPGVPNAEDRVWGPPLWCVSSETSSAGEEVPAELASESAEERQETVGRIVPRTAAVPARVRNAYEPTLPANAEDVLQLDLPDRLEVIQLLDLAAEYLSIDYMYEADKIRGQTVSLRLHGKLQGEIRVKDLYPLLESVLKFKGFAMTCHKGNLVTIVPAADALQVDPTLLDANQTSLGTGDMVVTRVFDLQYVNAASAMNLLDSMKLSVAASPIEETGTLIVTCYAYRMERIERLLEMVDRPGRAKEFRFRQLRYTMAGAMVGKVETLVAQLQAIPVKIAPMEQKAEFRGRLHFGRGLRGHRSGMHSTSYRCRPAGASRLRSNEQQLPGVGSPSSLRPTVSSLRRLPICDPWLVVRMDHSSWSIVNLRACLVSFVVENIGTPASRG